MQPPGPLLDEVCPVDSWASAAPSGLCGARQVDDDRFAADVGGVVDPDLDAAVLLVSPSAGQIAIQIFVGDGDYGIGGDPDQDVHGYVPVTSGKCLRKE